MDFQEQLEKIANETIMDIIPQEEGILYKIAEGIMRVRSTIRNSQPNYYIEFNL